MKYILAFLVLSLFNFQAGACELKSTFEEWSPYQFKDGGTIKGIDIEIAQAVAEKMGCKIIFEEMPWARQLKMLEDGMVDVVMAASKTSEREAFAVYKDGYRNETVSLFVKTGQAGKLVVNSHEDVAKLPGKIGVMKDNSYGDKMDAVMKANEAKFEAVSQEPLNVKKLDGDRIVGFLSDKFAGASVVAAEGAKGKVEEHSFAISSSPVFYIFSKKAKDPSIIDKWNSAVLELKKSGKIDTILKKYSL